jgi:TonB-linked SusC/RagA family outer membrane protein
MKHKLLKIFMACFLCTASMAFAQNKTITGTVTSQEEGFPIPGVTVRVTGTTVGTQTNSEGKFSIAVPAGKNSLTFSFLGYTAKSVNIGSASDLKVALSSAQSQLNEVVVVGYGTKSIREQNGSISHVTGKQIAEQPVESLDKALSGKTAGVQVSTSGGTLADGVSIRVRGVNSISLSSQPLYVIDGIPMNSSDNLSQFNGGNGTRFNPLALINSNDIESLEVLKDAGASAIYGSRAANGVVIITTKKGKAGTTLISFESKESWASPSKRPNLLGGDDFNTINNEKVKNRFGASAPVVAVNSDINGDGQPDRTDWMKEIFKTGFTSDNSLSLQGGTEKARYFSSVRYLDAKGILFLNRLRTAQVRTNIDLTPNKYVHAGVQLSYTRSMNNGILTDAYLAGAAVSGYNAFPTVSAYNPTASAAQGGYNLTNQGAKEGLGYLGLGNNIITVNGTSLIGNRISNPLATVALQRNNLTPEQVLANAFVEIQPITGLKLTSKYGVDLQKSFEDQYSNPVVSGLGSAYNGLVQDNYLTRNSWVWQNYASFDRTIAQKHRISLTAGTEYQFTKEQQTFASANNFVDPFFTNIIDNTYTGADPADPSSILLASGGTINTTGLESYFGRAGYTYDEKYFIEGSYRTDAFSGFGTNFRWGRFPSVSAGWIVSQEDFFKSNKYVNYLKIKGSYGKVGNSKGLDPYAYRTLYGGGLYATLNGLSSSQLGNADLHWETSLKTDIGFSLSALNSRITLDFDYFNNKINGLLLNAPVLYTVGVPSSSVFTNIGSMRNRGIEVTVNSTNIKTKDFKWTSSFNYTHVANKVLSLVPSNNNADVTYSTTAAVASVGRPLGVYKLARWAGVDPATGNPMWYAADGSIKIWNEQTRSYIKPDGTATSGLSADAVYQEGKTGNPTWFGGFDNTLTYKQFDLNISVVYSGGNYLYNSTYSGLLTNTFQNNDARILNRWTTPGQQTDVPRLSSLDNTANQASTRFLEKGDFARLRLASIGYNLPSAAVKSIGLTSLRISASVYNAFVITGYSGVDPEVNSNRVNSNIATGYDNRTIPNPRTYTLGLNASF